MVAAPTAVVKASERVESMGPRSRADQRAGRALGLQTAHAIFNTKRFVHHEFHVEAVSCIYHGFRF